MPSHPNRSKPAYCIWCDEHWPVCYDKHGNRFHVSILTSNVERCRTYRTREQLLAATIEERATPFPVRAKVITDTTP